MGMRRWTSLIGLFFVLLLWGCQTAVPPQGKTVKVSRAISGQTLEVLAAHTPQTEKIGLIGIDAPRFDQEPWGDRARQQLQALAGKTVLLELDVEPSLQRQDGSKLNLAYVWLDGILLNQQLVEDGLVLASPRSPNTKYQQRLARAQEKARLLGVGIWNPTDPMRQSPAEFRAQYPNP